MNLVYGRKLRRHAKDNITEFIVCIGKSEAELTDNKRLRSIEVL